MRCYTHQHARPFNSKAEVMMSRFRVIQTALNLRDCMFTTHKSTFANFSSSSHPNSVLPIPHAALTSVYPKQPRPLPLIPITNDRGLPHPQWYLDAMDDLVDVIREPGRAGGDVRYWRGHLTG